MSEAKPEDTQRDQGPDAVGAELEAEGFEEAHEIGRGGFGTVYRCWERSLDRVVAVKVLSADLDAESRARFVREQKAMAQLSGHPNVVDVLQAGVTIRGRPFIVMPYHRRDSLRVRIHRGGPLDWTEALRIGVKLAGALETAHRLGIVHRDVKPGNVLLTGYGEPQLTDFGIARITGAFETTTGAVVGSPAYTAPEVLTGARPTVASDVYSLGATLFCLVTGHAALERHSGEDVVAQFLRVASAPVPNLQGTFPRDFVRAIERAMARTPTDRPASAADFGNELRDVQRRHGHRLDDMALDQAVDQPHSHEDSRRDARHETPPISHASSPVPRSPVAAPPSVATKFRPPTAAARALVGRMRLIDRMRAAERRRLIVIHAPAGFGKSTLAAQWRDDLIAEGVSVAWFSIDNDDNNVVWFLGHLVEAIQQVRPNLASELRQELEEHGDEAGRYVVTSLINEIHSTRERFAVVIDDWHRISDPETIGAMKFLLENGCHHLQIIVTSRTRVGLPLSRMGVADELVEIDSADLRFDLHESHQFLVDLCGLALDDREVADLRKSTDGWVAALQLASLSLRNLEDPAELISHLSGRHRAIAEYLAENVLSTLEPRLLDFMLRTSITERICADLAAALTEREHCQALLEEVEECDLFLRALDEEREWFRYHHLFADFLRRRLECDHPEQVSALHRTAALWFADHALLSEAVDHSLKAGDRERAAELIEAHGMELIEHSQMSTLLGLIAKLPKTVVSARSRLQILLGWAHVLLHHRPEATHAALETVKSALAREAPHSTDAEDQMLEASLVQAVGDLFADRVEGLFERASECLTRPETLRPFVVSAAANVASFEAIYRFDFDSARRWQEWASPYHERTSGPFTVWYGYFFAGIAAREQLDIPAAEDFFREALRLARETGTNYSIRLAGAALGELLYERGNLDDAEHLLDESHQLGSEGGVVDIMLITYGTGARIKALRGDIDAAARRLDEGAGISASLSLPRLAARIENERIRCGLVDASGSFAVRTRSESADAESLEHTPQHDGIVVITEELREDSSIRLLLHDGSPQQVALACTRATAHAQRIPHERHRAHLQAQMLLASCLFAAGRVDSAKEVVAPAVSKSAELGLKQFLIEGGPQMPALARNLLTDKERNPSAWPQLDTAFLSEVSNRSSIG